MARQCSITGKKPQSGNNVSHSNRKTRTRWEPNLQQVSFPSDVLGASISLRLTANAIRTIEKRGGIDAFLTSAKASALTAEGKALKKRIASATAKKAGKKKAA